MEIYVPFFEHRKIPEFDDVVAWDVVDPLYEIRTGDVLVFSGSSMLSSVLKFFTASRWNHAGMVCWVNLKFKDGTSKVELFCFELGTNHYTDLMSGNNPDKEVRLVRLADIANMYDLIAVRQLNIKRPKDFSQRFKNFMLDWQGTPFIKSVFGLLKTYMFTPGAPEGEITCSALVAEMFNKMGIHPVALETTQLTPWHYSGESEVFPDSLFVGSEIVIYKDNKWLRTRNIFIITVIVILIFLLFMKAKKGH